MTNVCFPLAKRGAVTAQRCVKLYSLRFPSLDVVCMYELGPKGPFSSSVLNVIQLP